MKVIRALEGHEPWEFGAMPAERPLSSKVPEGGGHAVPAFLRLAADDFTAPFAVADRLAQTEGTWARVEREVWRGWFYRGPSCPSAKLS
jgi:hypothetical protein